MTQERWGAFSVIDHKNTELLVPEVLLYDRLVIPVPYNDQERQRWSQLGWDPELLDKRLEQLGDLAIKASWDLNRQKLYHEKMEQLKRIRFDADQMAQETQQAPLPYQMTRMILANDMDLRKSLSGDISKITVVSAYQSEHDFKADYLLEGVPNELANLGLLLGNKLAVPMDADHDKALSSAIKLARNDDFKKRRRKLYEWQKNVIRSGITEVDAINDLDNLIDDYNDCVKSATKSTIYRYIFTIAGIALSLAGGAIYNPMAAIGAIISVVPILTFDRKPVINAGDAEPAAMFHDVNKVMRWSA